MPEKKEKSEIELITQQANRELANPEVITSLIQTTFKGLTPEVAKRAIIDGMIQGFTFKEFLQKDVYAVPFKDGYSIITSIDYARKIGMRSGVCYNGEPVFDEDEKGRIISCSVTVKRRVGEDLGEFTAKVYFSEYDAKKNQWITKPRTMIAKVAEMHALRKACPEEMALMYAEEEMAKEAVALVVTMEAHKAKLESAKTVDELGVFWSALPYEAKKELESLKNGLKARLEANSKTNVAKPVETPAPAQGKPNSPIPGSAYIPEPEKIDEKDITYDNLPRQ